MKCVINTSKNKTCWVMVAVGLLLMAAGILTAVFCGEEEGTIVRMAGFSTGLGFSLAAMGAGIMIRRRLIGAEKSADCQREMEDERGQMIVYKAQNVLSFSAIFCIMAITVTATVRGDHLYMAMGALSCLICAVSKFAALAIYNRKM